VNFVVSSITLDIGASKFLVIYNAMWSCSDNTTRQLGVLKFFILMNLKSTLL